MLATVIELNPPPRTSNDVSHLLADWVSMMETYLHAVKVIQHQLPKTAKLVEDSTRDLSERFVSLAAGAKYQGEQMEQIVSLTSSLQLGNERITLEDFTSLFSKTLGDSIEKILFVSKRAITMVYMLDEALKSLATIEHFVADIQKINKQANLLALNATIESARAGRAGQGFAVVAHEVKQVSKHINQVSTEMRQKIIDVSKNVQAGYEVLKDVATTDMSDNMLAKEKLDSLLDSLIKQNRSFSETVHASAEATQEISRNISSMVVGMQFQDRTTQYVENSVALLAHMEQRVSDLLARSREHTSTQNDSAFTAEVAGQFKLSEFAQMFHDSAKGLCVKESEKAYAEAHQAASANGDNVELF